MVFARAPAGGPPGGLYAYLPVSWSNAAEQVQLHLNAGYAFDPASGSSHLATWNRAAEVAVSANWAVAAEVYGDTRRAPYAQAGVRWWAWGERIRLDLNSLGQCQRGRIDVSLGIALYGLVLAPPP